MNISANTPAGTALVVFNPASGPRAASALLEALKSSLRVKGWKFQVFQERLGSDTRHLLQSSWDRVIVLGGDGTIQDALSFFCDEKQVCQVPIAIVPCGRGNDFAKALRIPLEAHQAIELAVCGRSRPVDSGHVSFVRADGQSGARVFLNNLGLGLTAEIAKAAGRFRRFPGGIAYMLAALSALRHRPISSALVRVIDPAQDAKTMDLQTLNVSNGPWVGAVFRPIKAASAFDGKLDLSLLSSCGLFELQRQFLRALSRRYDSGLCQTFKSLELKLDQPLSMHADGEFIHSGIVQLKCRVLAGSLRVITPHC